MIPRIYDVKFEEKDEQFPKFLKVNKYLNLDDVNAIIIKFDEEKTLVQGEVIRTVRIENRIYVDFKFIGIPEATRDVIFRQIFKKQAELKKKAKELFEE